MAPCGWRRRDGGTGRPALILPTSVPPELLLSPLHTTPPAACTMSDDEEAWADLPAAEVSLLPAPPICPAIAPSVWRHPVLPQELDREGESEAWRVVGGCIRPCGATSGGGAATTRHFILPWC